MACPARLLCVGELILWSGLGITAGAGGTTFWLLRRFSMSLVVGSEIAGRMTLDQLAGITVSRNSVPTTVNPVATRTGCES